MQDTSNDVIIAEETETSIVLLVGRDRYKINQNPDSSWEPVLDRTWMNTSQLLAWLKDNRPKKR